MCQSCAKRTLTITEKGDHTRGERLDGPGQKGQIADMHEDEDLATDCPQTPTCDLFFAA